MSKGWDNAMIRKLKALTGKGLSTAEIGKRLGLSKNAVVGKLNRLGWNLKASTPEVKPAAKADKAAGAKGADVKVKGKKTSAKVAARGADKKSVAESKTSKKTPADKKNVPVAKTRVIETAESKKKPSSKSLAMHQRIVQHALEMAHLKTDQCRWPIGDPDSEDFHFCGEPVFVGKPYCYEHCRQAYQFTPPKKK